MGAINPLGLSGEQDTCNVAYFRWTRDKVIERWVCQVWLKKRRKQASKHIANIQETCKNCQGQWLPPPFCTFNAPFSVRESAWVIISVKDSMIFHHLIMISLVKVYPFNLLKDMEKNWEYSEYGWYFNHFLWTYKSASICNHVRGIIFATFWDNPKYPSWTTINIIFLC